MNKIIIHSTLTLLLILSFGAQSFSQKINAVVNVEGGKIEGVIENNVKVFKGIPFAQPPIGDLRWKAPQAVNSWEGIRQCTTFSASPMQNPPQPFMFWSEEFLIPKEPISEDCLYLNVWSKAQSEDAKLPVLVYIYGGGFQSGGSACPIYDGMAMANKDVVFVSFNYRVGVFGFFAHPELTKESGHNASGNYAFMDMIAALKWVQNNIKKFGGDPDNVTIAGQSAGAFAVNYLTASPQAEGLFHKALAQSGGNIYTRPGSPFFSLKQAEEYGASYAKSLDCENLAALRQKSAEEIQKKRGYPITPIIDGYIIPETIYETFNDGMQNDVPTIIGWNEDDIVFAGKMTPEQFPGHLDKQFGEFADLFLKAYPHENEEATLQSLKDLNRDEMFASQGHAWAKLQNRTGKAPAYLYNFNRDLPANNPETQFGAFHSGEVVYWYDNLHTLNRPWETVDQEISDAMSAYLVNFLKTGNPNGKGLPEWNSFDSQNEQVLILDKKIHSEKLPGKDKLMAWENYFKQN